MFFWCDFSGVIGDGLGLYMCLCVCERDVMILVEGKATGWVHSQNKGPRMR
jgi:hypothetical protein